eukprot:scaffold11381_cov68-Phaeocystis_antarctica.AAC.1
MGRECAPPLPPLLMLLMLLAVARKIAEQLLSRRVVVDAASLEQREGRFQVGLIAGFDEQLQPAEVQ